MNVRFWALPLLWAANVGAQAPQSEQEPAVPEASEPSEGPSVELSPEHAAASEQSNSAQAAAEDVAGTEAAPAAEAASDAAPVAEPASTPAAGPDPDKLQRSVEPAGVGDSGPTSTGTSTADDSVPHTTLGGYAQFNLTSTRVGADSDFDTVATLRRLVLYASHSLSADITANAELEWEHAIACGSCSGSAEVEQAYVDWELMESWLTLRAGLLLMPMGLINLWHEPPAFNGVERPRAEQVIIPTTWRELGIGAVGDLSERVSYQLLFTTTLVPAELGPDGFVGARGLGSLAEAKAFAAVGRLDYEPLLGLLLGASWFASDAGPNGDYYTAEGEPVDLTFPILGGSLHGRYSRRGLEARALAAAFYMPEAGALMNARRADGSLLFPNSDRTGAVPEATVGGYLEVGYDVLRPLGTQHQLLAFARGELYDTQLVVPEDYRSNGALHVTELTLGVGYKPIRQLVFKADVQLRDRRYGLDELQFSGGIGYMY